MDPLTGSNPQFRGVDIDIAPTTSSAERSYPVQFTGSAGEYFRIWIVNLALSIATLGIYSAWAKVLRKRYFHGHTRIDGEGFEYRANPIAILKGRLIAFAVLVIFSVAGHFAPLANTVFSLVFVFAWPWLIVRSLAFNAYNTAYRNIRLHFRGSYGELIKVSLGYGLLLVVSLGLTYPLLKNRMVQFTLAHHYYGAIRLAVARLTWPLAKIYAKSIAIVLLLFAMLAGLSAAATGIALASGHPTAAKIAPLAVVPFMYGAFLVVFAYLRARITNAIWNNATLGPVRFQCALRARDMFWLYLGNIVVLILTLGLATPWAVVRTMRYRAEKTTVVAEGGLERFVAAESAQVSATGEEIGEMFDIDIGL